MVNVVIQPFGLKVVANKRQTLHDILQKSGIELTSICGGVGRCKKCRVFVVKGLESVSEPTKVEQQHFSGLELSRGVRLACQVRLHDNVEVYVPKESVVTRIRLQTEGLKNRVKPLPLVKKLYMELPKPTLQSLQPDLERLIGSLPEKPGQPYYTAPEILGILAETLRNADWKVTTTLGNNKEIVDVEEGNTCDACYGVAVDVGTTKIAAYLVSLITGITITTASMVNPQVLYGEDVITRITYASKGETELRELQRKIVEGLNHLIAECCVTSGINPRHIYETVIVGNTAMHHLILGIPTKHLAVSPYIPTVKGALDLKAKEVELKVNPHATVHLSPLIAGFVGSDCVAAILATRLFQKTDPCLLLDIGTNTEVVVGDQRRLVACSCASGPAFEGAHIQDGMKASSGAIESAQIDPETLEVSFRTIDNTEPQGLCGSGIVDTIAEMLRVGIVNEKGTFKWSKGSLRLRTNRKGEREFVLNKRRKGSSKDIVVTQRDIREIQLAKGAIQTGITILLREVDLKPGHIKRVYVAGAFGTYINPSSARTIGMIPDVPLNIVESVGNAAGTGARMALISSKARKFSKKISKSVEYIELASHPDFQSVFLESLNFPTRKS